MQSGVPSLMALFSGWEGYQLSLTRAVGPLSPAQLAYRFAPHMRSAGEIAAHIAFGRVDWFHRMGAAGSAELAEQIAPFWHRGRPPETAIADSAPDIVRWLETSWGMVEANLNRWTVADLEHTYRQPYQGRVYAVSRQWTIWRIQAHDIHHGGQLSALLDAQGIESPDLIQQGGHIIAPPFADLE